MLRDLHCAIQAKLAYSCLTRWGQQNRGANLLSQPTIGNGEDGSRKKAPFLYSAK